MGAPVRQLKRRAAKAPAPRTATVALDGEYDGWQCTFKLDFRAGLLELLERRTIGAIIEVLDAIVTDHNLPNADGEVAARMAEVEPYMGLIEIANAVFDELSKLPKR